MVNGFVSAIFIKTWASRLTATLKACSAKLDAATKGTK